MTDYSVTWQMDITADSPREAAQYARDAQTVPGTWAVVFDVTDGAGQTTRIDLLDNGGRETPS